jgi:hypothetical protein
MSSVLADSLRETGTFEEEAKLLRTLKDKLDGIAAEHKEAEEAYNAQKQTILDLMQAQGISSTKIPGVAALSVTKKEIAVAEDWGQIFEYIHENNMAHILQKRLSSSAVEELEGMGTQIPGIGHTTTFTLNVRKA